MQGMFACSKGIGGIAIQHWAENLAPRFGQLEPETVSANFIDRVVRGAVEMGASRPRLLAAIRMADASLRNPIGVASRTVLANLFAAVEREFSDPAMAIRMAMIARPRCFSDLGFIARFAPTVGDMIADTVDIQRFRQNIWNASFDRTANPARLTWTLPANGSDPLDSAIEFSAASYVNIYRGALPGGRAPLAVRFRHQPRFEPGRYEELLGCPVLFGASATAIEYDKSQLRLPSPYAHAELQRAIQARMSQPAIWLATGQKFGALGYLYLAGELNKSPLTLDRLAGSFGVSERTLRRKLVDEGRPFRELLEKVRCDFCDLYRLEGSRSMGEVAELLGYSELSAFTRAHRRWYGQPPSQFERAAVL